MQSDISLLHQRGDNKMIYVQSQPLAQMLKFERNKADLWKEHLIAYVHTITGINFLISMMMSNCVCINAVVLTNNLRMLFNEL